MEVSYQFVCCGLSFCDEAEKPSEVGLIVMEYKPSCTHRSAFVGTLG